MRDIFKLLKKHPLLTTLITIITLSYVTLTLFIPLFFGKMIDLLNGQIAHDKLNYYIILSIVFIGSASILNYILLVLNTRLSSKIIYELKKETFDKLFHLEMNYFDTTPSGKIINTTVLNIEQFNDGLTLLLNDFLRNILTIIGVLIFMLTISYIIAIMVFLLTPLTILFTKFIAKISYSYSKDLVDKRSALTKAINETVYNQKNIINHNYQNKAYERFAKENDLFMTASFKQTFISSIVNPTSRFILSVIYALVVLVASIFIIKDTNVGFGIGALSALLAYVSQYTKPFNEITNIIAEIQNALACYNNTKEFLNMTEEQDLGEDLVLDDTKREIEFSNIYFSYDKTKKLITDCSFKAESGHKVAIVGQTGAGKTTLINLLMRFYQIDSGDIKLNGNSIYKYSKKSLRKQFGLVLQDTWIKTGSIYENLTMGENYPIEKINSALKECLLYDYVYSLPEGLNTIISSDKNLSLGQRQLLCIARVMLKNPNILLLDEATSNIDLLSEININKTFDKLMENKTTFVVAHRFKTIKNANLIVVLKDGNIIEIGNHDSLMNKHGYYYELFNKQYN